MIYEVNGKKYERVEGNPPNQLCGGCAFRDDPEGCRLSPDCIGWDCKADVPINYNWKEAKNG